MRIIERFLSTEMIGYQITPRYKDISRSRVRYTDGTEGILYQAGYTDDNGYEVVDDLDDRPRIDLTQEEALRRLHDTTPTNSL